ncbi:HpcH/HpaI aldolase/citrate lyase family protein [Hyphomonas sp.]|uniref:HpcH/HpaI aldolase/citrate lyase family protein n=1 Tax=Hyphomonas sp. TaxID=87 RepID=UPI00391DDD35
MIQAFRSLLFVPGARPDRFAKAAAAGADTIIIDLEDAVLPADKDSARAAVLDWVAVAAPEAGTIGVRINSPRTAYGCADIAAFAGSPALARLAFLMVPKAETGVDLEIVTEALGSGIPLIAVVESGRGLAEVSAVAAQAKGGVLFGGADYSASLGADLADWDAMITPRALISAASAAAGVPAYDVPYLDVKDEAGLGDYTARARRMGFSGRACIHPDQVAAVNAAFTPTEAEIADARAIIASLNASTGGAVLHKGKLVDRPVILAAERVLARAESVPKSVQGT